MAVVEEELTEVNKEGLMEAKTCDPCCEALVTCKHDTDACCRGWCNCDQEKEQG